MEKERTLKQLYTIVYNKCNKSHIKHYGICWAIERACDDSHITTKECNNLRHHLDTQRPTKTLHKEFYYEFDYYVAYWWPCHYQRANDDNEPVSTVIRSKFLRHLIKTL